ncbi:MAG: primosomal protein N' [Phycisphaerae bacterium]|jgi:primosomal protein N' (replication factor Y)
MKSLFQTQVTAEAQDAAPPGARRVVGVAISANVWRTFDYLWPATLGEPSIGQRVRVPFGKGDRATLGFVAELDRPPGSHKLKAVAEVLDEASQFDPGLWKLGQWISQYYLTPPGMVLAAMIPSAVGKHASRSEMVAFLTSQRRDWPGGLGPRQKSVLDELYEAARQGIEPLTIEALLHHSGAGRESIRRLAERNLIRMESRPVRIAPLAEQSQADPFELNEAQQAVLKGMEAKLAGGFSVTLLHGVTGSGKTEVYVRAIRQVIAAGKQAILLVPEIALATQTLSRLLQRLGRVAVLHSGLGGAERAFYYEQIREGHADVVVGPRSAIFAPARKLGLIIVDEEHEPTYKQDTVPRYHGRDVAVMRGSLAGAPVILGSATPSLESLRNVQQGRYDLVRLPVRVRGLPMPKLQVVHLRRELEPGKIELIGRTLTHKIAAALDRNEQVILLMNRRGYASYVFCPSCRWMQECDHCTRAMVFHQATQLVMCHYCQHTVALAECCPACKGKLLLFGLGIQRIESEMARKFPTARLARMDSDTMTSPGQFRKVFEEFSTGQLDVLLGTQMVAKGLDFPRVSLVGVVSADTSLAIPDFRSSERTFQLIVQVAGRAGRAGTSGEVVVQTLHENEPAILFASRHDYDGFAAYEMPQRKEAHTPPYTRMIRFIIRHADSLKAHEGAEKLAAELRRLLAGEPVIIDGPQLATVKKIQNLFRFQILLTAGKAGALQQILYPHMEALCRASAAEIIADVDPVHLL